MKSRKTVEIDLAKVLKILVPIIIIVILSALQVKAHYEFSGDSVDQMDSVLRGWGAYYYCYWVCLTLGSILTLILFIMKFYMGEYDHYLRWEVKNPFHNPKKELLEQIGEAYRAKDEVRLGELEAELDEYNKFHD